MNFSFHPDAEREFEAAVEYYERNETGLGYDFSIEVRTAIQNIVNYPNAWPMISRGIRRCMVKRFPYGGIYSSGHNEIFILSVMHLRRHPDYWKERY